MTDIENHLNALEDRGLYRRMRLISGPQGARVLLDGKPVLVMCSNNYLGLADHPRVREAAADAARRWGVGSSGSRLISGNMTVHRRLEARLAEFKGTEAALLFGSGYMANSGIIPALTQEGEVVFSDALNHASIVDGCRLSRAETFVYDHGDLEHLAWGLRKASGRASLIVTDSVFSMDGDVAPLAELLALAERHDALLLVDEAHGLGVLGQRGLGAIEAAGLRSERLVLVGTLGKAAGVAGAFVVAHGPVLEYLLQTARNYIFSTASPPALEHAVLAGLRLIAGSEGVQRRAALRERIAQWREGVRAVLAQHPELPWRLLESPTPVQALVLGDNAAAMRLSAALEAQGLRVPGIRPPTVPEGSARLRVTLCATHSAADVSRLVAALALAAQTLDVSGRCQELAA